MGVKRPNDYFTVVEQARGLEYSFSSRRQRHLILEIPMAPVVGIRGTTKIGVGLMND